MTGVSLNFDASQVQVEDRFEAIPAGWYNYTVTNTERKPSTQNPQNSYLEVTHTIMDGQYAGRKLFNRINLWNMDATAVDIAYKGAAGLAALQQTLGIVRCESSSQLHGIPGKVKVKVRPARTDPETGKAYDASNEISKYAAINADVGDAPGVGGSIAPGVAGAPAGTPPWAGQQGAVAAPPGAAYPPQPAYQPPVAAAPAPGAQPWPQPGAAAAPPPVAAGAPPWLAGAGAAAAPAPPPAGPPAAPPPQPVPAGPVMLPAATTTYEEYRKSGWTDEQLIANGLMAAPAAAGAPSGYPTPAGGPAGPRPPWAT